jgi:hypothetical protein
VHLLKTLRTGDVAVVLAASCSWLLAVVLLDDGTIASVRRLFRLPADDLVTCFSSGQFYGPERGGAREMVGFFGTRAGRMYRFAVDAAEMRFAVHAIDGMLPSPVSHIVPLCFPSELVLVHTLGRLHVLGRQ